MTRTPTGPIHTAADRPAPTALIDPRSKERAASLSIASNTTLIVLKLVAGAATGSIAILTEAVHSSIDLLASFVAFFSNRKADEPADESHMYGHEKVENLASALDGVLILVGEGFIIFESARRLTHPRSIESLGFGIVAIAVSMVVILGVSSSLSRAVLSPLVHALDAVSALHAT